MSIIEIGYFSLTSNLNSACSWQSQGADLTSDPPISLEDDDLVLLDFGSDTLESDFDSSYGLLKPEETVLIRAYSDDTDDRMLTEIKPKFIVMFEPDMDFVRRVEVSLVELWEEGRLHGCTQVYKSSNPGLAVRVYHMVYSNSCEEHKYLAGIRREKEAFERLIKERGACDFSLILLWLLIIWMIIYFY